MSKRICRNYTTTQKRELLKRHYLDKVPVSDLRDEAQLQPSVFYSRQHRLFENGEVAFESGKRSTSREQELDAKVGALEARLATKDSVVAEISAEFVLLKKSMGTAEGSMGGPPHSLRDRRLRARRGRAHRAARAALAWLDWPFSR